MKYSVNRRRQPLLSFLNVLIVLLAASGLYLILKPIYIHWQQDRMTKELQLSFDQGDGTILIDPDALEVSGEEVDYIEANESYGTSAITSVTPEASGASGTGSETAATGTGSTTETAGASLPAATKAPTPAPVKIVVQAIGQIKIPSIKVDMPIAEGATKYNLRVTIGHYSYSVGLGQPGLSVFFGHRMYTYGRHFNRLDEVRIGDIILIEDKKNRYTYEVDRIDTILPDQLIAELNTKTEGSRIMLVTCTPVRVASHRLLVKGNLIKTEPLGG